jgi:DNA modification methylase
MRNVILNNDCLEGLKALPDESVDCCVTSPPYWALRDYGAEGQLGLEQKWQDYINTLCDIFDEVKRVLKKEGTCWVNIGDTYSGDSSYSAEGRQGFNGKDANMKEIINKSPDPKLPQRKRGRDIADMSDIPSKSLVQIPARFSIEMTNRGWILRNEIIWHKPNAMPSSVKDRFTVDFEKIFLFTKSKQYYFEQQLEPYTENINRWGGEMVNRTNGADEFSMQQRPRDYRPNKDGKNKRTTWSVNTQGFGGEHFAGYPEKLIETPIKAGCPEGGLVLDPFMGSGTTAVVARKLGRDYLGFELNEKYVKIAEKRLYDELGMFL